MEIADGFKGVDYTRELVDKRRSTIHDEAKLIAQGWEETKILPAAELGIRYVVIDIPLSNQPDTTIARQILVDLGYEVTRIGTPTNGRLNQFTVSW